MDNIEFSNFTDNDVIRRKRKVHASYWHEHITCIPVIYGRTKMYIRVSTMDGGANWSVNFSDKEGETLISLNKFVRQELSDIFPQLRPVFGLQRTIIPIGQPNDVFNMVIGEYIMDMTADRRKKYFKLFENGR